MAITNLGAGTSFAFYDHQVPGEEFDLNNLAVPVFEGTGSMLVDPSVSVSALSGGRQRGVDDSFIKTLESKLLSDTAPQSTSVSHVLNFKHSPTGETISGLDDQALGELVGQVVPVMHAGESAFEGGFYFYQIDMAAFLNAFYFDENLTLRGPVATPGTVVEMNGKNRNQLHQNLSRDEVLRDTFESAAGNVKVEGAYYGGGVVTVSTMPRGYNDVGARLNGVIPGVVRKLEVSDKALIYEQGVNDLVTISAAYEKYASKPASRSIFLKFGPSDEQLVPDLDDKQVIRAMVLDIYNMLFGESAGVPEIKGDHRAIWTETNDPLKSVMLSARYSGSRFEHKLFRLDVTLPGEYTPENTPFLKDMYQIFQESIDQHSEKGVVKPAEDIFGKDYLPKGAYATGYVASFKKPKPYLGVPESLQAVILDDKKKGSGGSSNGSTSGNPAAGGTPGTPSGSGSKASSKSIPALDLTQVSSHRPSRARSADGTSSARQHRSVHSTHRSVAGGLYRSPAVRLARSVI